MADDPKEDKEMTANVHAGILAVMTALGTLEKENQNKFDKYDYASIDDFILFVRRHCYEAGIYIEQDETEARLVDVSKKDGKPMAMWWVRYAFTVRHVGGSSVGPIHRTVMVQANGAQAAGAAMAYALKQFMRSEFLIPTGDKDDPDKEKTEISAERGDNETDLQKKAGRIRRDFLRSVTLEQLKEAWAANSVDLDHIKRVSETAHEFLLKEYNGKHEELTEKERQMQQAREATGNLGAG
jgi:hypothetical protein